jgi:RNA polymerase sigma factor (sigma-70 family)
MDAASLDRFEALRNNISHEHPVALMGVTEDAVPTVDAADETLDLSDCTPMTHPDSGVVHATVLPVPLGHIDGGKSHLSSPEVHSRSEDASATFSQSSEWFAPLFQGLVDRLKRTGMKVHDAEDAAQEAILKWWEHLVSRTAAEVRNPRAWLRLVAVRAAAKSYQPGIICDLDAVMASADSSHDQQLEREDEAEIVRASMATLSERERELLEICYVEERTQQDAIERLSISLHQVRSTLMKGRARLHRQLLARGLGRATA